MVAARNTNGFVLAPLEEEETASIPLYESREKASIQSALMGNSHIRYILPNGR